MDSANEVKSILLGLKNNPADLESAFYRCDALSQQVSLKSFIDTVWPVRRKLKSKYHGVNRVSTLTKGNLKLDKSISIFSLPAVLTCPNSSECSDTCYARRPQTYYSDVLQGRFVNLLLAEFYPDFFETMTIQQIVRQKIKKVRIHESGDFYSWRYCISWLNIAETCPDAKFFFYTKAKTDGIDELASMPNVNKVESILPDGGLNYGPPDYVIKQAKKHRAVVCPATHGPTKHHIKCGLHCNACLTKKRVVFHIHEETEPYGEHCAKCKRIKRLEKEKSRLRVIIRKVANITQLYLDKGEE